MPPTASYTRIDVNDLLNDAPARGRIAHRATQEKPDIFTIQCSAHGCNRKFASKADLTAHQRRSHSNPTSFKCLHCHSTFSTSPNLNKHIRSVHEKKKPFRCDSCSASFAFKDGLLRHVKMVHDQVRPYACTHCSLKFKTKAHMTKHSYSLHPEAHQSLRGRQGQWPSPYFRDELASSGVDGGSSLPPTTFPMGTDANSNTKRVP